MLVLDNLSRQALGYSMNDLPNLHQESSPHQEAVGDFVVPTKRTEESSLLKIPNESGNVSETTKKKDTYDKADLDEYCLWLYSIYERLDIESNKRM
jgi:hypothetical protein